jgi:glycosyltransferase involved in cell wall biosynthesis
MRQVLFVSSQLSNSFFGGAEIQKEQTYRGINELNSEFAVKKFDMWVDSLDEFDLVHIFGPVGFPYESFSIARICKKKGIKVAVTPIFLLTDYGPKRPLQRIVSSDFRRLLNLKSPFSYLDEFKYIKKLLDTSDIILPNTNFEKEFQIRFFGICSDKFITVPNGVNMSFKNGDMKLFQNQFNATDFILFVGRIERRKNIDSLIRAFIEANLQTKLFIVGDAVDEKYYSECVKIAKRNVIFTGAIPNNSDLMLSMYKNAHVIALPSYLETPGLAALEGGMAGANVVVTEVGGTKEYFNDLVWYVNPSSVQSIRDALISAYKKEKSNLLSNHLCKNFQWMNTAKKTVEAYEVLLGK